MPCVPRAVGAPQACPQVPPLPAGVRAAGEKEKPPNRTERGTNRGTPVAARRRSSEKSTARLIRSLRRGTATLKLNLRPGSGAESRSGALPTICAMGSRRPLPALDSLEVRHITSPSALCRGTLAARDLSSSRLPVLAMTASPSPSSLSQGVSPPQSVTHPALASRRHRRPARCRRRHHDRASPRGPPLPAAPLTAPLTAPRHR